MILWIDGYSGVLLIKDVLGTIKKYITGTINTFATVAGVMVGYGVVFVEVQTLSSVAGYAKGYGRMSVLVNTYSTVLGQIHAYAHMYAQVFTRTIVQAFINLPIWVTEVIKRSSVITKIFKGRSQIDGD
jgi:hypothetical protein